VLDVLDFRHTLTKGLLLRAGMPHRVSLQRLGVTRPKEARWALPQSTRFRGSIPISLAKLRPKIFALSSWVRAR